MIPKITDGGRSFRGAFTYYLHDKGRGTRERVAWTETENLLTDDPDKAWKVMAYTAKEAERLKEASGQKMTGRKLTKPVFAYSLSWHPEQEPDKEHMLNTARTSLAVLGLTEHEAVIISHRDEPQAHVHVVVNRVHPTTGLAGGTGNSKRKLSDFAREYERENGKIYCRQREENHAKRQQGKPARYRDPVIAEAWRQSDSGRSFAAALNAKGYHLAAGRARVVVVDRYGQAHNPVRHLEKVRALQFKQRIADVPCSELPEATKLSREIQEENRRRYLLSRRHDEEMIRRKNALHDRHLEQRAVVSQAHLEREAQKKEELARRYRLEEQQEKIETLRQKAKSVPWWKKILGIAQKEEQRLEALEKGHENAKWRVQEQVDRLAAERERSLARLREQQEAAKHRQQENAVKPPGYVDQAERDRLVEHLREQRRQRERGGPTLRR